MLRFHGIFFVSWALGDLLSSQFRVTTRIIMQPQQNLCRNKTSLVTKFFFGFTFHYSTQTISIWMVILDNSTHIYIYTYIYIYTWYTQDINIKNAHEFIYIFSIFSILPSPGPRCALGSRDSGPTSEGSRAPAKGGFFLGNKQVSFWDNISNMKKSWQFLGGNGMSWGFFSCSYEEDHTCKTKRGREYCLGQWNFLGFCFLYEEDHLLKKKSRTYCLGNQWPIIIVHIWKYAIILCV